VGCGVVVVMCDEQCNRLCGAAGGFLSPHTGTLRHSVSPAATAWVHSAASHTVTER
jgi:hypothetical protein